MVVVEVSSVESDSVGAPSWEASMVPPRRPPIAPLKEVQRQSEQAAASLGEVPQ